MYVRKEHYQPVTIPFSKILHSLPQPFSRSLQALSQPFPRISHSLSEPFSRILHAHSQPSSVHIHTHQGQTLAVAFRTANDAYAAVSAVAACGFLALARDFLRITDTVRLSHFPAPSPPSASGIHLRKQDKTILITDESSDHIALGCARTCIL